MAKQQIGPIGICTHVFERTPHFDVYFNHMYCIAHWAKEHELVFCGKSGLSAARAREGIVDRCIKKGCSHVLFLDGDHLVPARTLGYLLERADEAMVSGLICKRGEHYQQVCWEIKEIRGKDEIFQVTLPIDGQVYEVSVCAFGCTLINLSILQKLKKPYFRDTCEPDGDGKLYNVRSDVNLCLAFKSIGQKVFVDTRVLVGHWGVPSVVYPQSAPIFEKLKAVERDSVLLRESQKGEYYFPGDLEGTDE